MERWPESKGPPVTWGSFIPSCGILSFDYVQKTPAPKDACTISDAEFLDVLIDKVGITFKGITPDQPSPAELWPEKVKRLRCECCKWYVTVQQVKLCVDSFSSSVDRVEVVVALWGRCIDRLNIWQAIYALSVRVFRRLTFIECTVT